MNHLQFNPKDLGGGSPSGVVGVVAVEADKAADAEDAGR